jgi:hypothetical protein
MKHSHFFSVFLFPTRTPFLFTNSNYRTKLLPPFCCMLSGSITISSGWWDGRLPMWHWSVLFNRIQIWFVYFLFSTCSCLLTLFAKLAYIFWTHIICSGYPWWGGCCIKTHNFWYHKANMWCSSGESWKRLGCLFWSMCCEVFMLLDYFNLSMLCIIIFRQEPWCHTYSWGPCGEYSWIICSASGKFVLWV